VGTTFWRRDLSMDDLSIVLEESAGTGIEKEMDEMRRGERDYVVAFQACGWWL
jgi:hypothetical protein